MTRRHSPQSYIAKAGKALSTARLLLQAEDPDGACNRAYYAMFDAAHAALFALGIEALSRPIKTHNGLAAMFGKEVIVAGHLPAEHGEHLSKVEELRLLADYSDGSVTIARATWAVARAEEFVAAVKKKFGLQGR
jgi:uncharacterized protein (UPF0332 family)